VRVSSMKMLKASIAATDSYPVVAPRIGLTPTSQRTGVSVR
jgi:hypothetical protein